MAWHLADGAQHQYAGAGHNSVVDLKLNQLTSVQTVGLDDACASFFSMFFEIQIYVVVQVSDSHDNQRTMVLQPVLVMHMCSSPRADVV
jgi:hypothetical protein